MNCFRAAPRLLRASAKNPLPTQIYRPHLLSRTPGLRIPHLLCRTYSDKSNGKKYDSLHWYTIPVGLGVVFLGGFQGYRIYRRQSKEDEMDEFGGSPLKRQKVKPNGPWQVQIMSTLPLKAISRLWGLFNELTIPYYLRVPGFKLYAFIFGVNLHEVAEHDLRTYRNLAEFFYRELKPGVRPLDPNHDAMLCPSDGRVLQFGRIEEEGDIEQVKGMNYHVDELLGTRSSTPSSSSSRTTATVPPHHEHHEHVEFARMNGISYTLPELLAGQHPSYPHRVRDESMPASPGVEKEVSADLAQTEKPWYSLFTPDHHRALYYAVVYLAPGDYHRFHSPTSWVVEHRRHFAGELYSVSPYLVKMLPGLFTLNERVVLLGRWRYGFFSFVPVGATNVGSIVVNFDRELRTNSLLTDTEADKAAEDCAKRGVDYAGYSEANYEAASPVLHGHALRRGEEMGGFRLGSTVVLVFEAPAGGIHERGWQWAVEKGQSVKMGQALGYVVEST